MLLTTNTRTNTNLKKLELHRTVQENYTCTRKTLVVYSEFLLE